MVVISPQIQAAEMRRREFVAQGIQEQWVDQMLAPSAPPHATGPASARASLAQAVLRTIREARHRLARPAAAPFGATTNDARMLKLGVR